MAQPIALQLPPRDPREELRRKIEAAPVEHAEAILAAFEVLQGLHDRGVLELARGLLGSGDKVIEIAIGAAQSPEATRGIRNLLILTRALGEMDPEVLRSVAQSVPEALQHAKTQTGDPPGLWAILTQLRSKNARRGLSTINVLIEAFGKNVGSKTNP
ncbi:MAG: hypothetical protein WA192_08385 [Candidatus Acidiferrales bacterium]